jgi:acyl-CoA thioesterase
MTPPLVSPFFELLGMRVTLGESGRASARMNIDPERHHQTQGVVHGGVLFSIADTAIGAALRTIVGREVRIATTQASINYLAKTTAGALVAEASILHRGATLCVGECDVFCEDGRGRVHVARMSATFMVRSA